MVELSLREHGRAYAAIHFKPINSNVMKPIDFKVDTGADVSVISKKYLARIGYDKDWVFKNVHIHKGSPMTTADESPLQTGYVQLPLINILGYEAKNWPFTILVDDCWKKDFRNLLGRDLLSGFNYTFDNVNDLLILERNPTFKQRYKFLEGQEINALEI